LQPDHNGPEDFATMTLVLADVRESNDDQPLASTRPPWGDGVPADAGRAGKFCEVAARLKRSVVMGVAVKIPSGLNADLGELVAEPMIL
jgi:hypothetical protein